VTRGEIEQKVREALLSVAPELASMPFRPDLPLRDQVDIDSMDFLRFIMAMHKELGVDVPEADYEKLASLSQAVDYVAAKAGAAGDRS
jgi:acyl carrier protein